MAEQLPIQNMPAQTIIHQTSASYQETFFTFVWNSALFLYFIAVIAYVLYTFKFIGPWKMKKNVSETGIDTWSQTTTLLSSAADIAKKFNNALEKKPEEAKKDE